MLARQTVRRDIVNSSSLAAGQLRIRASCADRVGRIDILVSQFTHCLADSTMRCCAPVDIDCVSSRSTSISQGIFHLRLNLVRVAFVHLAWHQTELSFPLDCV